MKNSNITKNRMRVALLLVLAASIIGLAPAFSASSQAGTYSVFSVSGNYVDLGDGWDCSGTNCGGKFIPRSLVGLVTFTPATGTFHAYWITRLAGVNHAVPFDGNYTVDADGHGTMTFIGAFPKQRDFYIVNGGAELKYIVADPPLGSVTASFSGTMTKQ